MINMNAAPKAPAPQILLIDDDPQVGRFVGRMLREAGFQVHVSQRPEEALHLAHEVSPDLVVTDLEMPGIDGTELCVLLKSREALRGIPVVVLSGTGPEGPAAASFSGADAYFDKPVRQAEFLTTLKKLCRASKRTLGAVVN